MFSKTKVKLLAAAALVLVIVAAIFLFQNTNQKDSAKLTAVTSFYPVYYFTSEIGGDLWQVENIVPTGVEPHDYEPTPSQMASIEKANIFFMIGDGFEPYSESIEENYENYIFLGADLMTIKGEEEEDEDEDEEDHAGHHHDVDPHVWLSPILAKQIVNRIADQFSSIDQDRAATYRKNADRLLAELDQLDADYAAGLQTCATRDFYTSHAAFAYLAAQYNLTQNSIAGLSPDEEPSAQKLAQLSAEAKQKNIKTIFFEENVSPKLSETLANEIGAQTLLLSPIENPEDQNYFEAMRTNLANLRIALECE
jgi:zinc transport system substrate-binding protein